MINYVEPVVSNPQYFRQFTCRKLLFLNYDCQVKVKKAAVRVEHDYIYDVLTNKKSLHTANNADTLAAGSIAFIKKEACIVAHFFYKTTAGRSLSG